MQMKGCKRHAAITVSLAFFEAVSVDDLWQATGWQIGTAWGGGTLFEFVLGEYTSHESKAVLLM
eukprot:scaffold67085_cov17-Tisochrysis_lutea.AAC.3